MTKANKIENTSTATEAVAAAPLKYDPAKLEGAKTSAKIRYLDECGLTRGQIAKLLDIRYQHVRNTLITPVAKPASMIIK